MANNIGWGQGASLNQIGWGQGATNNNIYWGYSQYLSESGETNIFGSKSYLTTFTTSFQTRITNDSGTFEGSTCLYNILDGNLSKGGTYLIPYEDRVIADSGIIEAENCLLNFLNY